ncbi:hypothetical protein CLAFUW4_06833 [Fulvia fulva]|uniref:Uncharacterized protein n=1 Tax=Passalora fulva TaxID=5499 RepID=A0A9Q8PAA5_PASFU|nr:uncharacterized protein CLAFUR5_06969 [Fulvia fulva]KAK4621305.1 hypothetical protein CLAFUR4_06841 [Fulvia fulva]KAK4623417.1 hypothetical protein CLAFUR0_06836 [Fulvia fulva]UJO18784.1 hypothetical protein CLAFUR5_06969 [Fulvia fulva]WPV16074.1 hypothetical protein CLAFUW4_06833 [Fulvia fulva]WPV31044.1 hypothetical protein CLAFUW7_06832 [Fulvia fulva]
MAPKKANWDVQRDHMLFMLLVDNINVNWNDVAKKWAEKYPNDECTPTGSAISQHISKLKKGSGPKSGLGAASKGTPIKTTPSAKRAAPPKTPSSSAKRARTTRMSDEDDSDEEKNMSFDTVGKRETPSRRSSGPRKSYREESDEEEDIQEARDEATTRRAAAAPPQVVQASDNLEAAPAPRDSVQADDYDDLFGGPRKATARSKSNPPKFDQIPAEDSDEDTFAPMV